MTFASATASNLFVDSGNLATNNIGIGNLLIVEVVNYTNSTVWCTGLSGGGVTTWAQAGVKFSGTVTAYSAAVFFGKVTATGAGTVTYTWSGTAPAGFEVNGHEFTSTQGAWFFDKQGNLDNAGTANFPSLTPGFGAGELYFGFAASTGSSAGTTSGYTYSVNANTDGTAFNPACGAGATFPVWASAAEQFGIAVLIAEGGPAALPMLQYARQGPKWFPGADGQVTQAGGIPFYVPPEVDTTVLPGMVLTIGTASAAGAGSVTATSTQIIVTPPQGGTDIMPPGWFPGADNVVTVAGGIPFLAPPPEAPVVKAPPYIVGASADGTHFTDQYGNPKMFVNEDAWNVMFEAGRFSGGDYRVDIAGYCAARSAQGYTTAEMSAYGCNDGSSTMIYSDGRDWDGTWPFNSTNDPSSGFNNTFWAKRDFLFATAASYGMSIVMSFTGPLGSSNQTTFDPAWSWTTQQFTDYGTGLGNRYKNTPNILWIWGDEVNNFFDVQIAAFYTALRATGDTHLISVQNGYPTTSRQSLPVGSGPPAAAFGPLHAQFNWCYDYCQSYNSLIPAANEPVSLGLPAIPAVWADGYYIDTGTTGGTSNKHLERNNIWWCLSSGGCGFSTGDGNVYQWLSGALAYITSQATVGDFYVSQMPAITAAFSSLPGWWKLRPDLGTLVTAGRGTFIAGGAFYYTDDSDPYITVAWASDGTLGLIYFPHGGTITVDQTKMGAGYTAYWMDPASGAQTTVTPSSSYTATGRPANSDGDEDWLLVLQGPVAGLITPSTGSAAGAGASTAAATIIATATAAGAGSATAAATWPGSGSAAGAGASTAAAVQAAISAGAGAGAATGIAGQAAAGTAAGAGTTATGVTQPAAAAITGAGLAVAAVTVPGSGSAAGLSAAAGAGVQAVTGAASAGGTASPVAVQAVTGTGAGTGTVLAVAAQAVTGLAAGAGSVTGAVVQAVKGTSAGAGSVTATGTVSGLSVATGAAAGTGAASAAAVQQATGAVAGTGSASGVAAQAVTGAAAGVSAAGTAVYAGTYASIYAATAPGTQIVTATAAGAGSVTAAGTSTGAATANAAGAGSATAAAVQAATSAAPGAGAASGAVTQLGSGAAAGAGTASAAASTQTVTGSATGLGAASAAASTQTVTGAAAGAGAAPASVTQASFSAGTGSGSATGVAVQPAAGTAAGASSGTAAAVQGAAGASAGAGTVTAAGSVSGLSLGTGSAAGAGAASAAVTLRSTGAAAGAGTAAAIAAQAATATAPGSGAITATAGQQGNAIAAGAGSVTAVAAQGAVAVAAGAGTATGVTALASSAAVAGTGAAPAGAAQAAVVSLSGSGAATALGVQGAMASGAGAGSVTAAGSVSGLSSGTATAAGAGAATGNAAQRATGIGAGAGIGVGTAVQVAGATLASSGTASVVAAQTAGAATAGAGAAAGLAVQPVRGTAAGAGSVTAVSAGSSFPVSSADTAQATESAFYFIPSFPDTATMAEGGAVVGVRGADRASGTDIPLSAWPGSSDAVRAVDRAASAWPSGADAGRATERVLPFHFTGADSAAWLEVIHEMGIWTYVPVNLRLLGKFWRITGTDERGAEVTILEGERITGQVLALAERLSWSRVTVRVSSADSASTAEAAGEIVGVSCWVVPAVTVSVTVQER